MNCIKKCAMMMLVMLFLAGVPVSATESLETIIVRQGETYSFTNIGEENSTVSMENGYRMYYDYILYDADGKIIGFDDNSSTDNFELLAGQKIEVTATGTYTVATFSKGVVTSKKEKTPCFEKIILSENFVYSFKNISGEKRTISTSGKPSYNRTPYALYDENGDLSSCNTGEDWTSKDIPANYTLKLLGAGDESVLKITFLKNCFEVKKENVPFFDTTHIASGESYSFKNISGSKAVIFSSGGYRDWRVYDENGNVVDEALMDEWGSGGYVKKEIPAGYTIELTYATRVNTPYGMFEIEKKKEALTKWITIVPGETYSFTNKTDVSHDLAADNDGGVDVFKDLAFFDSNGNLVSYEIDGEWKTKSVSPGQTVKISPSCRSFSLGFFTDQFDCRHENEPAFLRNIIHYGETYSFKNITNKDQQMISDAYAQYEIRDEEDNTVEIKESALLGGVIIKPGYTMYVTNLGTLKCAVLGGAFLVEKVSELEDYDYIDVEYGKTYKITNNNTSRYTFACEDERLTHDYASYYKTGKLYTSSWGSAYDISIQAGGYAIVTFYVNTSISSSSTITVEEVENPVFDKWVLSPHKKYSFENIGSDANSVSFTAPVISVAYSPEHDFPVSCSFFGHGGVGGKGIIETLAYDCMAYSFYGEHSFSEVAEIDYKIAKFSVGESGKMVNNASIDYFLESIGGRVDSVRYNSDGTVSYYDRKAQSPLYLPANSYVEFTALGDVSFIYPSEYIECEKITASPVTYYTIPAGKTAVIKNTDVSSNPVSFVASTCDYVKYDKDNNIVSYVEGASYSSSSYTSTDTLSMGEKIAITAFNSDLTIIVPKDRVTVNTRDYPALYKELVMPEGTFTFTNSKDDDITIYCSSDDSISYIIYDEDGDIIKNKTEYVSKLNISPNCRLEISGVQSASVFSAPYEILGKDILIDGFSIIKNGDNGTAQISMRNAPENACVLVATYTKEDKLLDFRKLTLGSNGIYSGNITVKDAKTYKAFVWESEESLKPLCEENTDPSITE